MDMNKGNASIDFAPAMGLAKLAGDSLKWRVHHDRIPPSACSLPVINRRDPPRGPPRGRSAFTAKALFPPQPRQRQQRDEKERAERQEGLVDAGGGGGVLDQRLDNLPCRRVDRAERHI